MQLKESLDVLLTNRGYIVRGEGIYEAVKGRRSVALVLVTPEPAKWVPALDDALKHREIRAAPAWARYVVLLVSSPRTPDLAAAASAFCRDVSKCRRVVGFLNQNAAEVLPFFGLSGGPGGFVPPNDDLAVIVERILGKGEVASSFLDLHVPVSQVQNIAIAAPELP